ncbi:signal peptidase II [Pedobacter metabolipauper]|uniref:Lipoprotein signal peptidase n=1 Tax=Pedobacter metabolipauper TaxID=425513 RepID=A0A4V3D1K2_9SPHI|nr:signal peptidase II [Pedobacter metabolipauper]TDQ11453.1 signal peptidase II [Pedobacter metabolipauper]
MKSGKLLNRLLILALVLLNVGCDQVTKSIVRKHVDYNDNIKVISDHITLTKVENSGAFLSSGDSLPGPVKFAFLSLLPLLVLGYGLYFLMIKSNLNTLLIVGISFVIGGGIGNLYDRISFGSVTDFLHIDFVWFQTGVFNAADLSIMSGMLMILISQYMTSRRSQIA